MSPRCCTCAASGSVAAGVGVYTTWPVYLLNNDGYNSKHPTSRAHNLFASTDWYPWRSSFGISFYIRVQPELVYSKIKLHTRCFNSFYALVHTSFEPVVTSSERLTSNSSPEVDREPRTAVLDKRKLLLLHSTHNREETANTHSTLSYAEKWGHSTKNVHVAPGRWDNPNSLPGITLQQYVRSSW